MGIHLSEIRPLGGLSREETREVARALWAETGKTPGGFSAEQINGIIEPFRAREPSLSFDSLQAAGWFEDEETARRRGVAAGRTALSNLTGQIANAPSQPRMTPEEAAEQARLVKQRLDAAPAEIDGIRINTLYLFGSAVRDNSARPTIGDLDIAADFGYDAGYDGMDAATRSAKAKAVWDNLLSQGDERLQLGDAKSLPVMAADAGDSFRLAKLWQNPTAGAGSFTPAEQQKLDGIARETLATQKRAQLVTGETLKGWYLLRGYSADFDPLSTIMDMPKDEAIATMERVHPTRGIGEADANGNRDQKKYYQLRTEADTWLRNNSDAAKDRQNPIFFALTNDPETVRRAMNAEGGKVMMMPLAEADLSKFSITFDDSMGNYRTTVLDTKNTGVNGEFLPDKSPVHGTVMNAQQFAAAIAAHGDTDGTGAKRNIEAQYWGAEPLAKAQVLDYDPALPKPPRTAAPKTVTLFHGTSEANLGNILENGFEQRYTSARDRVRSMIGEANGGTASEADVDRVLAQRRINGRVMEVGNLLYTSSDRGTAEGYGYKFKEAGGEINGDIQVALGRGYDPKAVHDNARPVLLTLEVPEKDILPAGGELRTDAYETLVKSGRVKVATVTFAAQDASGGWSFDGQPALSPTEAAQQLQPQFAAKPARPPNPEQQRILKTINDFALGDGVTLKQDTTAFMYVAETRMKDASGHEVLVRIPDSRFERQADGFEKNGFKGVAADYTFPHDLTAAEADAYMKVLEIKEQRGQITAADKNAQLKSFLADIEAVNPALKGMDFDRNDPAKVSSVLKGAVNGFSAENLQHHISGERAAGYDALKKQAQSASMQSADIDLAPATLEGIKAEMDRKFAVLDAERGPAPGSDPPAGPKTKADFTAAAKPPATKTDAPVQAVAKTVVDAPAAPKTSTPDAHAAQTGQGTAGHSNIQAKAGRAQGAAQVAVDVANGNYGAAATGAATEIAMTAKTYEAAAELTSAIKPVAKAIGFVGKRIPLIGAAVTAGFVLWEAGSAAVNGEYGKAGAALAAGGAEALGNIAGFGVGDLARETVRETVVIAAGEQYAPNKSGLRQLGEGAYAAGSKFVSGQPPEQKTSATATATATTSTTPRPKTPRM